MVGLLSQDEIEILLLRSRIGRIGCYIEDQPYVVPVNYAYDGSAVYILSASGRKIDAMRSRPHVCFEVDEIVEAEGSAVWRSVIADGVYDELTDNHERQAALTLLAKARSGSSSCTPVVPAGMIVFRIDLTHKTGRFGRE